MQCKVQELNCFSFSTVRKCSRFQFECRSTSECIAIYNACDGIPQCADGSDEAPELECPPPNNIIITPAPPAPTQMKNPGDFIKYENKVKQYLTVSYTRRIFNCSTIK